MINQGKTGFICQNYEEMIQMIPASLELSHQNCRESVETKFNVSQMVNGYEAVYQQIIEDRVNLNGYIHTAQIRF